ncbi:hypothetical protein GUITHDRAFT_141517 [Guillardia theta CCMP2712]|uniref:Uncharacterized protein n=1 Tax=Guillardia theta (strain CCMP2712) TaxID=905079 RepID=L1J1S9_GUITC|nr:hypothetical protein GUITHDRAFT_141517 [Guillardia theta CCMP2712]EKX42045.1 hypothetical protein GUITHDRAFT_141517 [Guillardia theta CCMP2712]|eukprot:XP_005829025.1 hypothetical protein GUITHDRAFT_141517 [Guillardia theta CCMP2712]
MLRRWQGARAALMVVAMSVSLVSCELQQGEEGGDGSCKASFKHWISEGATAFPRLKIKTSPGMDPIMQFQDTEAVPEGNLGKARVDISVRSSVAENIHQHNLPQEMEIGEDPVLADKAEATKQARLAKEEQAKKEREMQDPKISR